MIQKEQNANGFYIFSSGSFALFFCSNIVRISGKRPGRQQMGAASKHEPSMYWCVWYFHVPQEPGGWTSWSPLGVNVEARETKDLLKATYQVSKGRFLSPHKD